MAEIEVKLPSASYKILIESGSLDRCGERIRSVSSAKQAVVITDKTVWGFYGARMEAALIDSGFFVNTVKIEPGEGAKPSRALRKYADSLPICTYCATTLSSPWGGVVGDLAGFTAAVYMRIALCTSSHNPFGASRFFNWW